MRGRGLGYCAGYGAPGYMHPAPDLGRGRGRWAGGWGGRGGRGWRHWYHAAGQPGWTRYGYPPFATYAPYGQPPGAQEEAEFLKDQAEALRRELEAITQRLDELEKEA